MLPQRIVRMARLIIGLMVLLNPAVLSQDPPGHQYQYEIFEDVIDDTTDESSPEHSTSTSSPLVTSTIAMTTTTKRSPSSDLGSTDIIIVAVVCVVCFLMIVGVSVYGISKRKKLKQQQKEMHERYLVPAQRRENNAFELVENRYNSLDL